MLPDGFLRMNKLGSRQEPFLFIVGFDATDALVLRPQEALERGIFFQVHNFTNSPFNEANPDSFYFRKSPIPFEIYQDVYNHVIHHINAGNSYLINLTFPTPIETNLTLKDIFIRSQARYKLLMENYFVVFSPEIFVQIHDGMISSFPMKGTIDATIPDACNALLQNPKELAEHHTIVDLIRNDLSMVASQVRVEKFRYIEEILTNFNPLLQASSKIVGRLPSDYQRNLGDIFYKLLPAGSVSGAPKQKTLEIIHETEVYQRGFYTGVAGWFDGHDLDSGVLIRFIEKTPQGMVYKSGGGITSFSDSYSEYQEMIDKVYVPFI